MRNGSCSSQGATVYEIIKAAQSVQFGKIQVKQELRDFKCRQKLLSSDNRYFAKVALFGHWLVKNGYQEIVTTMLNRDALIQLKNQQEVNRVKEEEVAQLISGWDLFWDSESHVRWFGYGSISSRA